VDTVFKVDLIVVDVFVWTNRIDIIISVMLQWRAFDANRKFDTFAKSKRPFYFGDT